jgi:hypothetical protein
VTYGRLGDAQLFGRAGEAEVPARGLEGAERVQRQLGAVHLIPKFS